MRAGSANMTESRAIRHCKARFFRCWPALFPAAGISRRAARSRGRFPGLAREAQFPAGGDRSHPIRGCHIGQQHKFRRFIFHGWRMRRARKCLGESPWCSFFISRMQRTTGATAGYANAIMALNNALDRLYHVSGIGCLKSRALFFV
jgi:hypothetical protein